MSGAVEIDNKKLLPIKDVVGLFSYSRDYITRLAREGKIEAAQVGRMWYVDTDSLAMYQEQVEMEAAIRKRHLSEERKREREAREQVEDKQLAHDVRHRSTHRHAVLASFLVLTVGVLGGVATQLFFGTTGIAQLAGGGFVTSQPIETATPPRLAESPVPQPQATTPRASSQASRTAIVSDATTSVTSLGDTTQGVVLFPDGITATTTDLFSDPVQVTVASSGAYVQLQDETGAAVGEPIPFIEVPVEVTTSQP